MNSSSVSIARLIMSALLLSSVLVLSCKKEEADDPNIEYRSINKSVTSVTAGVASVDSFDINNDGKSDLNILAVANVTADSAVLYIVGSAAAVYIDSTQTFASTYKIKNLYKDEVPEKLGTQRLWGNLTYAALRRGTDKKGYAGVGDVFIPVFFRATTLKIHYGWIRINVSSDFRTLKVVDAAYHVTPETSIAMGAK